VTWDISQQHFCASWLDLEQDAELQKLYLGGKEKMMKKTYIKVRPLPGNSKTVKTAEQRDKEARIIALAEKLHVKIGG